LAILLHKHGAFFDEVFHLPGFFAEPVLCFGFQDIRLKVPKPVVHKPPKPRTLPGRAWRALGRRARRVLGLPPERGVVVEPPRPLPKFSDDLRVENLEVYLRNRGIRDVTTLDHFDPRASLRYDMNEPVPASEHERYGTVLDIGCLEHLFDTRRCLENCLRMLRTGGLYFLHTPVNGYLGHGLHTFNPEALLGALQQNGFEILYHRYCAKDGTPLDDPAEARDAIIWLVARKTRPLARFEVPQQGKWYGRYPE
jgi:SAM-dependent methyltransferase